MKSLTTASWGGSGLEAPWASSITIKGDSGADMNLIGADSKGYSLGKLSITGTLSDADITLNAAAKAVWDAIAEQTCGDLLTPYPHGRTSRPGETKLDRLVVRLNDFTNHIGAIRTMRRVMGNPVANRPQRRQRKDYVCGG